VHELPAPVLVLALVQLRPTGHVPPAAVPS
jgi:hypothetical protein